MSIKIHFNGNPITSFFGNHFPQMLKNESLRTDIMMYLVEEGSNFLYALLAEYHNRCGMELLCTEKDFSFEYYLDKGTKSCCVKICILNQESVSRVFIVFQLDDKGAVMTPGYFVSLNAGDTPCYLQIMSDGSHRLCDNEMWEKHEQQMAFVDYFRECARKC